MSATVVFQPIDTSSLPSDFSEVVTSLQNDRKNLDPAYQSHVADPFLVYLEKLVGVENTNELTPLAQVAHFLT